MSSWGSESWLTKSTGAHPPPARMAPAAAAAGNRLAHRARPAPEAALSLAPNLDPHPADVELGLRGLFNEVDGGTSPTGENGARRSRQGGEARKPMVTASPQRDHGPED